MDGDRLDLEISVGPGARAFVSSQGPTRVFRSSRGAAATTVARVEEGGALMLFPDPTACFGGARYAQRTEVSLAPGGSLALWDVLSAGRDRWGFTRCESTLRVLPFLDERWLLDPAHGPLEERMGRFGAIGTLLLVGPLFAGLGQAVRERVDARPAGEARPGSSRRARFATAPSSSGPPRPRCSSSSGGCATTSPSFPRCSGTTPGGSMHLSPRDIDKLVLHRPASSRRSASRAACGSTTRRRSR